jgi:hypothetical protein
VLSFRIKGKISEYKLGLKNIKILRKARIYIRELKLSYIKLRQFYRKYKPFIITRRLIEKSIRRKIELVKKSIRRLKEFQRQLKKKSMYVERLIREYEFKIREFNKILEKEKREYREKGIRPRIGLRKPIQIRELRRNYRIQRRVINISREIRKPRREREPIRIIRRTGQPRRIERAIRREREPIRIIRRTGQPRRAPPRRAPPRRAPPRRAPPRRAPPRRAPPRRAPPRRISQRRILPRTPPPRPPPPPPPPKAYGKRRLLKAFDVYAKKYGRKSKAVRINAGAMSYINALNYGKFVTDNTPLASFRLVPTDRPISQRFGRYTPDKKFRGIRMRSRLAKGSIVEKAKYRIDKPGELYGITYRGLRRLRSQKSIVKRLLSFTKKGRLKVQNRYRKRQNYLKRRFKARKR